MWKTPRERKAKTSFVFALSCLVFLAFYRQRDNLQVSEIKSENKRLEQAKAFPQHIQSPTIFFTRTLSGENQSSGGIYRRFGLQGDSNKCTDTFVVSRTEDLIIDVSCTRPYHSAFFHRLVDCFLPSFCAFAQRRLSRPTLVVVPRYLLEMYQYFTDNTDYNLRIVSYADERRASFCLNVSAGHTVDIVYPEWNMPVDGQRMCLAHVTNAVQHRNGRPSESDDMHLTLISRACRKPRCFKDATTILAHFTSELGLPGKMYFGNETFQETVNLFYNSRVVVGYHGAGFANTIFCRNDTIVLEFTTFHDMNGTKMWRSNEGIAQKHKGLKWIKHTIDIDHMTDLDKLINATDKDHYIKSLRYVDLTGSDMHNSVERIKTVLQCNNQTNH